MSVQAIGLQHVQLSVEPSDFDRSFDFYTRLVGMPQIHDPFAAPGKGFWVGAGEQSIHIRVETGIARDKTRAHPAVIVNDLAACQWGLEAEGFPIFPQPKLAGFDRFHTNDPSGNRLEIMQRTDD